MSNLPEETKRRLWTAGKGVTKYPALRVVANTEYFQNDYNDSDFLKEAGLTSMAATLAQEAAQLWEKRMLEILTSYCYPSLWTVACVLTEVERTAARTGTCILITPMDNRPRLKESSGDKREDVFLKNFNAHTYGRDAGGHKRDSSKGIKGDGDFAIIQFNPFTWDKNSALRAMADLMYAKDFAAGMETEDVLFHEIVHALRVMQGLVDDHEDKEMFEGYNQIEDFLAVVLTNIAISERNPTVPLRRHHNFFETIPTHLSTSSGFLSHAPNVDRLKKAYIEEFSLFHNIAGSPHRNSFNPIREMIMARRP